MTENICFAKTHYCSALRTLSLKKNYKLYNKDKNLKKKHDFFAYDYPRNT